MGRLAQQHDARRADTIHHRIEIGSFDRWEGFGGIGDFADQRGVRIGNRRQAQRRASLALRIPPALLPDQWNKTDVGNVLAAIFVFRNAGDPDQFLGSRICADRDHQAAADFQLLLE